MFGGIVTEVGVVDSVEPGRLRVKSVAVAKGLQVGGSVAVNGVCLTATEVSADGFSGDVMPETLRRTSLGRLEPGDGVNLEAPLKLGEEVGGHIIQGHVDGTGEVLEVTGEGNSQVITIRVPPDVAAYCVVKGAVAVDGVSLTIAAVNGTQVKIGLIPHTLAATMASSYKAGSIVNLEADILAKYVERYLLVSRNSEADSGSDPGERLTR
jgi:riboflavin synthase